MPFVIFVFFASFVSFASFASFASDGSGRQQDGAHTDECQTAAECRAMALDAIAAQQYERAHDLAWRTYRLAPRNDHEAMALLARSQSLFGRGSDAFVMLQRLIAVGGNVDDLETSDDFRRVREHPRWPDLSAELKSRPLAAAPPKAPATAPEAAMTGEPIAAPSAPAGASASAPEAAKAEKTAPTPVAEAALAVPVALAIPSAFAHDAVSARFVVADASSDILRILSEDSGHATTLVSPGWSKHTRVTAVSINRDTGDLWIASHDNATSALHRFQLISGRLLRTIQPPDDAGATRFVAAAVAGHTVFALDAAGSRVFAASADATTLRLHATLPKDVTATGLVRIGTTLIVSDGQGLLRVNRGSGGHRRVRSEKHDVSRLHSLAWVNDALLGLQEHADGPRVVRIRLNASATTVVSAEVIQPAASLAGSLSGADYYFVTRGAADGRVTLRRLTPGK